MILTRTAAIAAILLAFTTSNAIARPKAAPAIITCDQRGCSDRLTVAPSFNENRAGKAPIETVAIVGGRPAGCPRQYCGCGVSLKVFGKIIPELNLALNWKKRFPRTSPAPGMVAARSGHVFYIESVIDHNTVIAYDPNSGGGKTRIHERSLRGYTVVNPHGSLAMN